MVSGFLDELDPDDNEPTQPRASKPPPSKHVTLTSDEEGGEEAAPIITQDQDVDSEPELKVYVSLSNSMKQSFLFKRKRLTNQFLTFFVNIQLFDFQS